MLASKSFRGGALLAAVAMAAWGALTYAPLAHATNRNGFNLDDALVPTREIVSGGIPKDGLKAIDEPNHVAAGAASFVAATDPVLALELEGEARAYPIAILEHHEVVNDRLAATSVVMTYCPLCGSGIAFTTSGDDRFAVSGLLYNSNLLLYDRKTESLWSQIDGRAIAGPRKGERLNSILLTRTTWQQWRADHPDTLVMSPKTDYLIDYRRALYPNYEEQRELLFPVTPTSSRRHPKTWVLGVTVNDSAKAYPIVDLKDSPNPMPDCVGRVAIRILHDVNANSARAQLGDPAPSSTHLRHAQMYWFAWKAFYPDTELFAANRRSTPTQCVP